MQLRVELPTIGLQLFNYLSVLCAFCGGGGCEKYAKENWSGKLDVIFILSRGCWDFVTTMFLEMLCYWGSCRLVWLDCFVFFLWVCFRSKSGFKWKYWSNVFIFLWKTDYKEQLASWDSNRYMFHSPYFLYNIFFLLWVYLILKIR